MGCLVVHGTNGSEERVINLGWCRQVNWIVTREPPSWSWTCSPPLLYCFTVARLPSHDSRHLCWDSKPPHICMVGQKYSVFKSCSSSFHNSLFVTLLLCIQNKRFCCTIWHGYTDRDKPNAEQIEGLHLNKLTCQCHWEWETHLTKAPGLISCQWSNVNNVVNWAGPVQSVNWMVFVLGCCKLYFNGLLVGGGLVAPSGAVIGIITRIAHSYRFQSPPI